MSPMGARRRPRTVVFATLAAILAIAGCATDPSPSPSPTPTPSPSPTPSPTPTAATPTSEPTEAPTPTPEPELSLPLPDETDDRTVTVSVAVEMPADEDGTIVVTVTSAADSMIDELVLRWPDGLHDSLFPSPFVPSAERIREGGPPLVQPWTKWVVGPGERGEPAGTISLGYGPLPAAGTLEIPLYVTRRAPGPVAFDLQVLAGEAILTGEDGSPAELRVEVP